MDSRGFKGLTVWNRTVDLVEVVYRLTDTHREAAPPEILADMRRDALAVPSHLASGYETDSCREYLRHVHAAQLIVARLESRITILQRLDWGESDKLDELQSLLAHIDHLLESLERYLLRHRTSRSSTCSPGSPTTS